LRLFGGKRLALLAERQIWPSGGVLLDEGFKVEKGASITIK
jgi:hypothetical protein